MSKLIYKNEPPLLILNYSFVNNPNYLLTNKNVFYFLFFKLNFFLIFSQFISKDLFIFTNLLTFQKINYINFSLNIFPLKKNTYVGFLKIKNINFIYKKNYKNKIYLFNFFSKNYFFNFFFISTNCYFKNNLNFFFYNLNFFFYNLNFFFLLIF